MHCCQTLGQATSATSSSQELNGSTQHEKFTEHEGQSGFETQLCNAVDPRTAEFENLRPLKKYQKYSFGNTHLFVGQRSFLLTLSHRNACLEIIPLLLAWYIQCKEASPVGRPPASTGQLYGVTKLRNGNLRLHASAVEMFQPPCLNPSIVPLHGRFERDLIFSWNNLNNIQENSSHNLSRSFLSIPSPICAEGFIQRCSRLTLKSE